MNDICSLVLMIMAPVNGSHTNTMALVSPSAAPVVIENLKCHNECPKALSDIKLSAKNTIGVCVKTTIYR